MKKVITNYLAEGKYTTDWLGFLRISVAVFALLHFLAIQPDFTLLYSSKGMVQPDILDALQGNTVPTMIDIHAMLVKLLPGLAYDNMVQFFRFLYITSLICLAAGFATRMSALFSLLTQLILINSIHFFQYGADSFTTILLFYCFVLPTGKVKSLDNYLFRKNKTIHIGSNTIYLRILQLHLCIVYFVGGIDKMVGDNWRNGEAFWKAITSHNLLNIVDLSWLKGTAFFWIGGWATILLELLYPVFINMQRTRKLWLGFTVAMHIGIVVCLGLTFFGTLMIIFNLSLFYVPYLKQRSVQKRQPVATASSLLVAG